jgi:hypothetical protein
MRHRRLFLGIDVDFKHGGARRTQKGAVDAGFFDR